MKAVILAGGFGTRLAEETDLRPKPMVEIGGWPILWHIMKLYSSHGIDDFVICLGYKGHVIREYFLNYMRHASNLSVLLKTGEVQFHSRPTEEWTVTMIDTGLDTQTGGRLKRIAEHISDETFCMTYGDGVSDVDVTKLILQHRRDGLEATVTTVRPPGRFGAAEVENGKVVRFTEKPLGDGTRINAGFFVLEPSVLDRISGDDVIWERQPLEGLARDLQLGAYHHSGFWQPMDTLRDKRQLEEYWNSGNAPWRIW